MTVKKYANGSNILLNVGGKAIGHCTNHTISLTTETKDRAIKPVATADEEVGLWKETGITGLSLSIQADGLVYIGEEENGYAALLALAAKAEPVEIESFYRSNSENPFVKGSFVITSVELSTPAEDDSTYTIQLQNNGKPEVLDGTKFEPAA